jgi:CheY-like chemotaxis protein
MDFEKDDVPQDSSPRDAFIRAKIELYLERAAECFDSGRYHAALQTLDGVWRLDPSNLQASELHSRLNTQLQRLSASAQSEGLPDQEVQGTRRPEVILVADQDPRIRRGLIHSLQGYGFLCVGAEGYDEALAAYAFCQPSVVLSEVNFADGPRGFDLFHEIKNSSTGDHLVFFFLVAHVGREVEIAGRKLGVDDFLRKPLDNEVVATMITRSLYKRQRAG